VIISDIAMPFAEGASMKDILLAKHKTFPPNDVPNSLRVFIVREPFDDFYTMVLDSGQTEEFDEDGTREWLLERGAEEELVNKAITQAWNFKSAILLIRNPVTVQHSFRPEAPQLTIV
jgi:hypothetical protein